jgi:hypothetical protein
VVVHQGNSEKGHYITFVKPAEDPHWALFDDHQVQWVQEVGVFPQEATILVYTHPAYIVENETIIICTRRRARGMEFSPKNGRDTEQPLRTSNGHYRRDKTHGRQWTTLKTLQLRATSQRRGTTPCIGNCSNVPTRIPPHRRVTLKKQ